MGTPKLEATDPQEAAIMTRGRKMPSSFRFPVTLNPKHGLGVGFFEGDGCQN